LGLIYDAFNQDGIHVKIDGPASLFKLTRRYGTALAKLIPSIIANLEWKIDAKILWKYTNEILSLSLDRQHHESLLKKIPFSTVEFDSEIEEKFSRQFEALQTNWVLKREPEPLIAGNHVLIPDFSLANSGLKIYVEIMGFWTEKYLERKILKLTQIKEEIVLLVNENLACEKMRVLQKYPKIRTIYYKKEIPLGKLLKYLNSRFNEIKEGQIEVLRKLPIKFTQSIVSYSEFADQTGTSIDAVTEVFMKNVPSGYVALSNVLISEEILGQIDNDLREVMKNENNIPLTSATKIVEKYVKTDVTKILGLLGYKIIWKGIDVNQAKVYTE
jgi:hypothetical protein